MISGPNGPEVGKNGEKRVVITMNGKFLPHIEQLAEDNTVPSACFQAPESLRCVSSVFRVPPTT